VLGGIGLALDLDLARAGEFRRALDPGDLVLLEQELHALGVGGHHLALAGLHAGEIELDLADLDPVILEGMGGLVKILGGLQQRLGGDAADIETGAAQRRALLDAGDLESQLGGADGADIAARPRPDDDDVESFGHVPSPGNQPSGHSPTRRAGQFGRG
jgi:hypothetical protein